MADLAHDWRGRYDGIGLTVTGLVAQGLWRPLNPETLPLPAEEFPLPARPRPPLAGRRSSAMTRKPRLGENIFTVRGRGAIWSF
jgi:hypothetical protein